MGVIPAMGVIERGDHKRVEYVRGSSTGLLRIDTQRAAKQAAHNLDIHTLLYVLWLIRRGDTLRYNHENGPTARKGG